MGSTGFLNWSKSSVKAIPEQTKKCTTDSHWKQPFTNGVKDRGQKAKRLIVTLNLKSLNQILWFSPSLFLFSSSFSSSFLSFPATDKRINPRGVTAQSTSISDPVLTTIANLSVFFRYLLSHTETIVPGSWKTPLWYAKQSHRWTKTTNNRGRFRQIQDVQGFPIIFVMFKNRARTVFYRSIKTRGVI